MKTDREELAMIIRDAINRGRSVRSFNELLAEEKEAYRDAAQAVLDKLNQPETPTLTQVEHLKHMGRAASDESGRWWQRIRCAMKSKWIPVCQYVPEPGKSLLIRRKTGAVEEAQFDGSRFHEHSRPDMPLVMSDIVSWTYLYEPSEQT